MNAMDLMTGLNNVRDKFVVSAGEFRQGQREVRALPKRKLWLIAAVIALALLLVGCAVVYVLRLQDMAFGQETQEAFEGDIRNRTLLSLQGVKGTPGYQATKEWYEWLQTYDTDMSIYHSEKAFSEDFGDDYYAYNLYTREMKDKLDEICAKYHLNLLGKMYVDPDEAAACKALGIQGILRPGVQAETNFGGMRYYADGSFTVEGRMTLTGQNSVWPYEEIVTFSCARKDGFSEIYASIGPEGSYEEWTYTTSDGVDMLIVLEQRNNLNHHAFMVADRGDYVLTFSALEYDHDWTKAALEAFAEAIDFTVQPQRVTEESLAEAEVRREDADKQQADDYDKHIRAYVDQGYEARIKSRMEFSTHPAQLGFCVMDLDGDGVDELLVGENGYIIAAYNKRDGGTQYIMPPTVAYPSMVDESSSFVSGIGCGIGVGATYMHLCEDNVLAYVYACTDGSMAYHFAKVENGTYVWDKGVVYYTSESEYFRGNSWLMYPNLDVPNDVPITEEEFNKIVQSHPRVPVTLTPVAEYPFADTSPSGIGGKDVICASYREVFQSEGISMDGWECCLIDLDGDGQEELFLTDGGWRGVLTIKGGKVKILECGADVTICEGNYIAHTQRYLDGNSATSYYKVQNGNAVLVDYLRYDKGVNPENPWFYGADALDESLQPVSQEQYEAAQAKYVPLKLETHPVATYPLP